MTAAQQPHPVPHAEPPYLVGDRVQVLYMSERGTILADARASFHLVPADRPAKTIRRHPRPARVIYGVDHTKPTE